MEAVIMPFACWNGVKALWENQKGADPSIFFLINLSLHAFPLPDALGNVQL
jgi:hypothetical protein